MHGRPRGSTVAMLVLLMVLGGAGALRGLRSGARAVTRGGPEVPLAEPARVHLDWIVKRDGGVRVDLYLPPRAAKPARLVIYLQGGDWSDVDDKAMLAPALGGSLQREGVALAAVSFRVGEGYGLDRCASDVEKTIAELLAKVGAHHVEPTRPLLLGYETGGWLSALLALSPALRAAAGLQLSALVVVRGTFDLNGEAMDGHPAEALFDAAFTSAEARREASPVSFVGDGSPTLVLLNGATDPAQWAQQSRDMAVAYERAGRGRARSYQLPGRSGPEVLNLAGADNDVRTLLIGLLEGRAPAGPWANGDRWTNHPRFSSASFWKHQELVTRYQADERFVSVLRHPFQQSYRLKPMRVDSYAAIDLGRYLDARADELGSGAYLTITNVRGSRQVMTRADIDAEKPRIVIGIDDERELFRLFSFYRPDIAYSWRPELPAPPEMIRPIGPFVYFPEPPAAHLRTTTYSAFGLTGDSFVLTDDDPLRKARAAPALVQQALLGEEGCLTCHSCRGEGAHGHHLRASDGEPVGGKALPLEDYPAAVLKKFLFQQETVADRFGFEPLLLEPDVQRALFDHVAHGG